MARRDIKVRIFTKEGCHLCEEAKELIYRVQHSSPIHFELEEVDITSDVGIYERFKEEIPVIFIDGKKAFKYRLDEREFRRRLARAAHPTLSHRG
ncbi:MAG: glutaredoxin family protein [Nitrospinae bacterium]|nr:glutaredoxin family protein [Nitrospinota bacterium]